MILGVHNDVVGHTYGHPKQYYEDRNITLDCRGTLKIDPDTMFGFNIQIFTLSHDMNNWEIVVDRPVSIGKGCFIGSGSIFYNCKIGDGCVISVGSVVANCEIPAHSRVEGNPCKATFRRSVK
jgi:acetyltransferase-like isoleucine patch superfamily enzyme